MVRLTFVRNNKHFNENSVLTIIILSQCIIMCVVHNNAYTRKSRGKMRKIVKYNPYYYECTSSIFGRLATL